MTRHALVISGIETLVFISIKEPFFFAAFFCSFIGAFHLYMMSKIQLRVQFLVCVAAFVFISDPKLFFTSQDANDAFDFGHNPETFL